MPLFSIVIPTRNRPETLSHTLWSIQNQTFGDFECIVSDNGTTALADRVVSSLGDPRIRYKKTPRDLNATDSWNFANEGTLGEYVISLHDKIPFHLDHLERVADCLSKTGADLVNWNMDRFFPADEMPDCFKGTFHLWPKLPVSTFELYDGREALKHQAAFPAARGDMGESFYVGQVHGGCSHQSLRARIVERTGRLFHTPYSDYTARVPGLLLAKKLAKMSAAGGVCICFSTQSIGWKIQTEQAAADAYLQTVSDGTFDLGKLPFPALTLVVDNVIALCYQKMMRMLPNESAGIKIHLPNLWLRCEDALKGISWTSEQEKQVAMEALARGLRNIPALQRLALRLRESPKEAVRRLATGGGVTRTPFAKRFATLARTERHPTLGDNCGVREGLLYLALERALESDRCTNPDFMNSARKTDATTPASAADGSKTALLLDRMAGDPALGLLVEILRARPGEVEKGIAAKEAENRLLQEKVTNLKGMIERRDARIAKLEKRLGVKKVQKES